MFYDLEANALFWESLDALEPMGDPVVIAMIVDILTRWALELPKRAPADKAGIRLLKAPSARLNDIALALRLAYFLDEHPKPSGAAGTIVLLHVEPYDELADVDEMPTSKHWQ